MNLAKLLCSMVAGIQEKNWAVSHSFLNERRAVRRYVSKSRARLSSLKIRAYLTRWISRKVVQTSAQDLLLAPPQVVLPIGMPGPARRKRTLSIEDDDAGRTKHI
jgi:hypothetical protein